MEVQAQTSILSGKRLLIGVSGGIAIYKTLSLLSLLNKQGVHTEVVMTKGAQEFVRPLAFQTMSQHRVYTELFSEEDHFIPHIDLSRDKDAILVAPASADFLARTAQGRAEDLLSAILLAAKCPILLSPAMNVVMYENAATQQNLKILRDRGMHVLEPGYGWLACNETGAGRMPEASDLLAYLEDFFTPKDLAGKRIVVTGGGTRERLDPVRFLTNDSSGKQGLALAKRARMRGAEVLFIHGSMKVQIPNGLPSIYAESTEQMLAELEKVFPTCDALVMAAAPCDYRPEHPASHKMKKDGSGKKVLHLCETPDILRTLTAHKEQQCVIGFAAETQNLLEHAQEKRIAKKLDYIIANDVSQPGVGFDGDTNRVTILSAEGARALPMLSKEATADAVLDLLV